MFQFPGCIEKTSCFGISAEGYQRKHEMQVASKRSNGKTTECSKHLRHIIIEKDIFSELNRCIFQISHNYITLFQKYSLYWYFAVFIFTSKLRDPPPPPPPPDKITPSSTTIYKIQGVHAPAMLCATVVMYFQELHWWQNFTSLSHYTEAVVTRNNKFFHNWSTKNI